MRNSVARVFGLDPRSLAVMRVGLAAIVLYDLAVRGADLTAHYTDTGVLPRGALYSVQHVSSWSLHLASGEPWFQAVMFAIAAIAAVLLAVGYHARLMAFALAVLTLSLIHRNPMVANSGDLFLQTLLLWASLLPIGGAWSLDRRRGIAAAAAPPTASLATAGFVWQIALFYIACGVFKLNDRWLDGEALATIFSDALYARPIARDLLAYPQVLAALSRATPWIEIAAGVLLLVPWWNGAIRLALIAGLIAFHAGIELTITVGLFGYVAAVAWLALLPTAFWDRLGARAAALRLSPSTTPPPRTGVFTQAAAVLLTAIVTLANAHALFPARVPLPPVAVNALHAVGQMQDWDMFRRPREKSGYYLLVGKRDDGSAVELLTGLPFDPLTVRRPDDIAGLFPNHRWRKYYRNLAQGRWQTMRPHLARPLCNDWNAGHADATIVTLEVNYIEESPGESPKRLLFFRGVCPGPNDIAVPAGVGIGF